MIVIYHLPPRVSSPLGLGQAAMELFFVLSGYLISLSLVRSVKREGLAGIGTFALRRVRRLLPGMIGFLIGGFLLNVLFKAAGYPEILWASFAAVTGWYNFYQCYGMPVVIGFGGIWSLSLEEQFYLSSVVVVLLCRCFLQKSHQWLFLWAGLLLAAGFFFRLAAFLKMYDGRSDYLSYLPPLRTWGFGLGVLVAALTDMNRERWARVSVRTAAGLVSACVAAMAGLIASVNTAGTATFMFQWAAVPVLGAVVILFGPQVDVLILAVGRWQRAGPALGSVIQLSGASVRCLGKASYSVYLWHCLVIAAFVQLGWSGTDFGWLIMLTLSLICGVLSWRFIEQRFYSFS